MSEEIITSNTVVKDMCFAAWVVQACSRLRGAPTKLQALAMVEDYFNEDVEQPVKKSVRPKAGKLDAEREAFLTWVSDKLGRELNAKELRSYTGKFNYHMGKGSDPYEQAFKESAKAKGGKPGRKPNPKFKAWLEEHERVKGAPLTSKEITSLRNKWYSSCRFEDAPSIWENRGAWPTCNITHLETGVFRLEVIPHGDTPSALLHFNNRDKAEESLQWLDNHMIELRNDRTPEEVFQFVMDKYYCPHIV